MANFSLYQSILIFGGSFDPPHIGHVQLPELARQKLQADLVLYIPAAVSPFKTENPPTAAQHRINMLELALADQPHAAIDLTEIERADINPGRPSYTVDTLRELRKQADQVNPQLSFRLLIGTDQMRSFDQWREHKRIEKLAEPVVMVRPDMPDQKLFEGMSQEEIYHWRLRIIDLPLIDISSSQLRQRVALGQPIDDLVSEPVAEYIRRHALYTSDAM